ncbi:MAG: hypothetical protein QXT49_07810 [Candidatus Nezhaarchaeales archaeon]
MASTLEGGKLARLLERLTLTQIQRGGVKLGRRIGRSLGDYVLPMDSLRLVLILGSRQWRVEVSTSMLYNVYAKCGSCLVLDSYGDYRQILSAIDRAKEFRVGVNATLDPFTPGRGINVEDYALILCEALRIYLGLGQVQAALLLRALLAAYQESSSVTLKLVLDSVEGEAGAIPPRTVEELKGALLELEAGRVGLCLSSVRSLNLKEVLEGVTILDFSFIEPGRLKALAKTLTLIKLLSSWVNESVKLRVLVEDYHELGLGYVATRNTFSLAVCLINSLLSRSIDCHLNAPSKALIPIELLAEADLKAVQPKPEGSLLAMVETRLQAPTQIVFTPPPSLKRLTDSDVKALMEARGYEVSELQPPRRRIATTLELLFPQEEVRSEAVKLLSYLRDNYSTFTGLFELSSLQRNLTRSLLLKLYRGKYIEQVERQGVKLVTLTDAGRLLLEEYEASLGGEEGEGGRMARPK